MSDYEESVDIHLESGDWYDVNVNNLYKLHIQMKDEGILVDLYDDRNGDFLFQSIYYLNANM